MLISEHRLKSRNSFLKETTMLNKSPSESRQEKWKMEIDPKN